MVRKRRVGPFRAMDPRVCTAAQDNGPTRFVWYGQIEASGQTGAGRRPYPFRRLCIFARLAGPRERSLRSPQYWLWRELLACSPNEAAVKRRALIPAEGYSMYAV
jgi:hypothetical protein